MLHRLIDLINWRNLYNLQVVHHLRIMRIPPLTRRARRQMQYRARL